MKQPWIKTPLFDSLYILAPPFVALGIVGLLPDRFKTTDDMPLVSWVLLVVLVDVAHVYSTLFRTYANPTRFRQQRLLFWLIPLLCYGLGVTVHSLNGLWFWRCLAYLAVFHFIRQQYGFLRIYSRTETVPLWVSRMDGLVIYMASLYPIFWWHVTPGRHFNWFVDGDFLQYEAAGLKQVAGIVYACLLLAYVGKEGWLYGRYGWFNTPKNLLVAGTVLSWYVGIVQFNGDLTFTLLNVISHGVPYMALIWASDYTALTRRLRAPLIPYRWIGYLGGLALLAYLEEGLWDGFVWREHQGIFGWFQALPAVTSPTLLAWVVPLLALPQMTHYVLDGFIWRGKHTL